MRPKVMILISKSTNLFNKFDTQLITTSKTSITMRNYSEIKKINSTQLLD